MKSLAACLIALGLWFTPWPAFTAGVADLREDSAAYRMRMCELVLWSGESPLRDGMLDLNAGADVPYGAFAPAATAFALARLLPAEAIHIENGVLDEDALARGARRLLLVQSWIAAAALCFAGARLARGAGESALPGRSRFTLALVAAAAWSAVALWPHSEVGSVSAAPWGLMLCPIVLAGAAWLRRPRDLGDQIGVAIGLGFLAGLALANDPFAWPTLIAPLVALGLVARQEQSPAPRNALRTAIFFVATTLIVSMLRTPWPVSATPWPELGFLPSSAGLRLQELSLDVACVALIAWLLFVAPAHTGRGVLAVVLVLCFALRTIDTRFELAPMAPAGVAAVWCAQWLWFEGERRLARRVLLLCSAAGLAIALGFGARDVRGSASTHVLRELRQATAPSGAWNHPMARQQYAILANPRAAGSIVFHARRPVVGGLLPGAQISDSARQAAAVLLAETTESMAQRAIELGAGYVVVERRDLEHIAKLRELAGRRPDDQESAGSALRQMLTENVAEGFVLLRRVPNAVADDGPAELAVWRTKLRVPERGVPTMGAR